MRTTAQNGGGVACRIFGFLYRNEEKRIVALMCNYKFDIENGIAIVFENEKLKDIGIQDIIL